VDSPGFSGMSHQYGQGSGTCAAPEENWAGRGFALGGPAAEQRVTELRARAQRVLEGSMQSRWYARPNDLIGGWCVMPVDEPPSGGMPEVADFIRQEAAGHIAALHNQWLDTQLGRPA
jgi:hypothetical protein